MQSNTSLTCPLLPDFDDTSWAAIKRGFAKALKFDYQQAWLKKQQAELVPARGYVGWHTDALLIYAELGDRDIYNPVTVFNEVAFTKGDVFEIFLRPLPQPAYYELHVTPNNQIFQLRFPSATVFRNQRHIVRAPGVDPLSTFKIPELMFTSRVKIDQPADVWMVYAKIPFNAVVEENGPFGLGSKLLLSLSRYDYTRSAAHPVLSSASPHKQCNYHRQQEWAQLTLA